MIKASRRRTFEWVMRAVTLPQIRKQFQYVYWQGPNPYPSPAIYIANHSSWWDGLIYFHLRHTVIDRVVYILMHEKGLKKFPYFKWIGAYSVNKASRRDVITSLQYSKELIESGKSIWIFPQGDEYHQEQRPLKFETGVAHLASQLPQVPIIPLTFYYSFGHEKKADLFIRGGDPIYYEQLDGENKKDKMKNLEYLMEMQLENTKSDCIHNEIAKYKLI